MTNQNTYFHVQMQFAEFILYRDEKTPIHHKTLIPLRAFVFKAAKPTGPQQQTSSVLREANACLEFFFFFFLQNPILSSYLGFK